MVTTVISRAGKSAIPRGAVRSPLKDKTLLKNAWNRVLRSRHVIYKNFLRRELEAFGTASDMLLNLIYEQLDNENYEPQVAYKVYLPKSKHSNRTFLVISIPDWVVYTAITTLILEKSFLSEKGLFNSVLFSNFPLSFASGRPASFFRRWQRQYSAFNNASRGYVKDGFPYLAEVDITSFYDLIDHALLLQKIRQYFDDVYSLELLSRMLAHWSSGVSGHRFAHGIPQGPEASQFLADLFLYDLDKDMASRSATCRYARYVDDIRIFTRTRRKAESEIVRVEEQIKTLGLVPNVQKVRVVDARNNLDWLKEESSEALAFKTDFMEQNKGTKSLRRLRHMLAKPTFLDNCKPDGQDAKTTYLTRLSLPKLLPDKQVIERILQVYESRADLYDLIFPYLKECKGNSSVIRFCWRQLRRAPIRDWENANIIYTIGSCVRNRLLGTHELKLLTKYAYAQNLPLSASAAASLILYSSPPQKLRPFLRMLPKQAIYLPTWLPPSFRIGKKRKSLHRSVRFWLRQCLTNGDERTQFLAAYFWSALGLPASSTGITSPYAARLLIHHGRLAPTASVDEIAPILKARFRVSCPQGFNFQTRLAQLDPKLYEKALQHLRLAVWYIDTSPTYFVNHIHNFNHVLLYFALRNGNYVKPSLKFKLTFREIALGQNQGFQKLFPTLCAVFKECSDTRNTNVSTHPYDDIHSRFATWVTYKQRDALISRLRAAYKEFIRNI